MSWHLREGSSSTLRGAEVLVMVLPLGGTPDTVFREYVDLLSQQSTRIELNGMLSSYKACSDVYHEENNTAIHLHHAITLIIIILRFMIVHFILINVISTNI